MSTSYSLKDVAAMLRLPAYKIEYRLAHGRVPEPAQRIGNRRVFMPEDVQRLAEHFGVKLSGAEAPAQPAAEIAGV